MKDNDSLVILLGLAAAVGALIYFSKNARAAGLDENGRQSESASSGGGIDSTAGQERAEDNLTRIPVAEYKQEAAKTIEAEIARQKSLGRLPSGPGRNVAVNVQRPQVDESQTSASKNKEVKIVNPTTGKLETVRDVFRQSYAPTGIQVAELGQGRGGRVSASSAAKLASRPGSAFAKRK